jgi:diacylglycerol kinase (ATP)
MQKKTEIQKRLDSFGYAFKGIKDLFLTQRNAQIHLTVSIFVIIAGFFFNISKTEWLICILLIGLILAAEALNTALEFLTDLVSPDYHELAGKTKDVAAAAVLLLAIAAAIIGVMIFWQPVVELIFDN